MPVSGRDDSLSAQSNQRNRFGRALIWQLGVVAAFIFGAETILMLALDTLLYLPPWAVPMIDALVLTILVTPVMYLAIVRSYQTSPLGTSQKLVAADETKAQFDAVFEGGIGAAVILGSDLTVLRVNSSFVKLCGFSAGEVESVKNWSDFSSASLELELQKYEQAFCNDILIRSREDGVRYCTGSVTVLNDSGHRLVSLVDMTATKEAQEELEDKSRKYNQQNRNLNHLFNKVRMAKTEWERTMDCVDEMVILFDQNGLIRRCNSAFKEFIGMEYIEVLGREIEIFFNQFEIEAEDQHTGGARIFHQPSGRWFLLKSYNVSSVDSEQQHTVLTVYDLSEVMRINRALEHSNRELEDKRLELESAYNELQQTQAKIIQQEKMASIGQLAAGVAHEVNNPVGFIASNLRTLEKYLDRMVRFISLQDKFLRSAGEKQAPDEVEQARVKYKIDYITKDTADLIAESLDGAERVRKIVMDLKGFSRSDQTEYQAANINECLDSTINIVWNEIKYKAELIRDYGDVPSTYCYPQQLNQVFVNLLVNASQAIEKQGEIKVKTSLEDHTILISISDNGCGIPEANLPHLFDPFFTTKDVGEGTGLGMSIVYDIIQKHKGTIKVDSQVGAGTTFEIRIPLIEKADKGVGSTINGMAQTGAKDEGSPVVR